MYSTFCSAANSLSQIYTQAMNQQKLAFQAGERHALEKLYQWIIRQHEEGSRVTLADIVGYLQNGIGGGHDTSAASLRPHYGQTPSVLLDSSAIEFAPRPSNQPDQSKNSTVFSNALSSPVRRSLQPYHLAQTGEFHSSGGRSNEGGREANSHDSSMDMHSDSSPARHSY